MNPLIRDVRPAEYAAVARLLVETYGGEGLVQPAYLAALEDTAARATGPDTDVIVALGPGSRSAGGTDEQHQELPAVIGTATLALAGAPLHGRTGAGEATLRMLAVHPGFRCRGVGTALVTECIARARLAGATALGLDTTEAMTAAQRLYDRLGFARMPERDAEARSGGMLRAYRRTLAPAARVCMARPEDYSGAGTLTLTAYVEAGLIAADDAYAVHLRDAERRAHDAELLVAHSPDGDLLGTVTYCPTGSAYGEIARPDEGEFRMLAVAPHAQRRGVGEALVRACMRRAWTGGKCGIALSTATTMLAAHRMYERLGFARDAGRDWQPVAGVSLLAYAREL